eukprot:g8363.t1
MLQLHFNPPAMLQGADETCWRNDRVRLVRRALRACRVLTAILSRAACSGRQETRDRITLAKDLDQVGADSGWQFFLARANIAGPDLPFSSFLRAAKLISPSPFTTCLTSFDPAGRPLHFDDLQFAASDVQQTNVIGLFDNRVDKAAGAEGNIGVDGVVVAVLGVEHVEGWIGWIVVEEELPAGCKVVGPVRLGGGMDVAPTAVPDGAATGNDPANPAVEAVTG